MRTYRIVVLTIAAIVFVLLAVGCGPAYDGTWNVVDEANTTTPAFRDEIEIAAAVIRAQEGVSILRWGGTVTVYIGPFTCPQRLTGMCAGFEYNEHEIAVALCPSIGLGPDPGTTALEHELCHAAGHDSEDGANECARQALPAIKELLTQRGW